MQSHATAAADGLDWRHVSVKTVTVTFFLLYTPFFNLCSIKTEDMFVN